MTLKTKLLLDIIGEKALEIKNEIIYNLNRSIISHIEEGFPTTLFEEKVVLRQRILDMSLSEFLELDIDDELFKYWL